MNIFILLAIALAPGIAIALYVYWRDEHEKEPVGLLIRSFFYGALSVVITLAISLPLKHWFTLDEKNLTQQAVHAFIIVALIEEFSKFVFVRGILYRNKNFNEPFDGIVYSVMVSMGFATCENLLYINEGGIGVGIMRMFTAVPAHAAFAVLMGYYLGKAKFEHKKGYYAFHALGVATLLHGGYDYFWFISYVPGIWIGAILSLVMGVILSKRAMHTHQQASPFIRQSLNNETHPKHNA